MPRFFNTAGPVNAEDHYVLDPLARIRVGEIEALIEQKKYFVLHAPRQTGKTSSLKALERHLNAGTAVRALYMNVETAQAYRENVDAAMSAILSELAGRARDTLGDRSVFEWLEHARARGIQGNDFNECLTVWCGRLDKPLVLLIDEIDALVGDTLISVLRQLRGGYDKRPRSFPQSVILCGVRDIRDYRIHASSEKAVITGGSAFNIKAESLRLGDFSRPDLETLYAQHTTQTGQAFTPDALEHAWELTLGQPWLVNALAYEACWKLVRDRAQPITAETLEQAKENLILRRETHLDQLADKLREERVRKVIQPILATDGDLPELNPDHVQYVIDLGLVRRQRGQALAIANPIYREVIPRELTFVAQEMMNAPPGPWFVRPDGTLDMAKLLTAFQQFFRENAESWIERFEYKEAGPQLLMQAFLQRIVNGGGRIEREYALGAGRTDLLVLWDHPAGRQRVVIELKILHKGLDATIAAGLEQTAAYADRCRAQEAHLVVFDRTPGKPWEEKIFTRTAAGPAPAARPIAIWGM